jgi:hypothetical protein
LHDGAAYLFEAERSVLTLGFTDLCTSVGALIRGAPDGQA